MAMTLNKPVGPLAPGRPDLILCAEGVATEIEAALATLRPGEAAPPIREGGSLPDAEDVFDAMVGHLAGRAQPDEPSGREDWRLGFEAALAYCNQAPWQRWSDAVALRLKLRVPSSSSSIRPPSCRTS
ncbi:MAG: hypothetical protein ACYC1D_03980 [Acidimicrobiales bacterium]